MKSILSRLLLPIDIIITCVCVDWRCCVHLQMRKVKEKSMKRATTSSSSQLRQLRKATAIVRPVIELPTTKPDFDCCGTVSELELDERDGDDMNRHSLSASMKIVRTSATPQRQSQSNAAAEQKMPPELTVTGAQQQQPQQPQQKSNDELIAVSETNRGATDKSLVSELPSIGRAKRHFAWHTNIKKCVR